MKKPLLKPDHFPLMNDGRQSRKLSLSLSLLDLRGAVLFDKRFGKNDRVVHVSSDLISRLHDLGNIYIPDDLDETLYPNQPVVLKNGQNSSALALVDKDTTQFRKIQEDLDFMDIKGRNKEQKFLVNLLSKDHVRCVVVTGPAGSGKAQPLDSKILTKDGWRKMGEIDKGDQVATPDGDFARVTGTYPQGEKEIYRVHFSDGSSTECCKDHLWKTKKEHQHHEGSEGSVRTLEEIREGLKTNRGRNNHFIPTTDPVDLPEKDLPLDPYFLGLLIGDGSLSNNLRISSEDDFIINECEDRLPEGCQLSHVRGCDYDIVCKDAKRPPKYGFKSEDLETGEVSVYQGIHEAREYGYSDYLHECVRNNLTHDNKKWTRFENNIDSLSPVRDALIKFGLDGKTSEEKFIPDVYLTGSISQRISLLRGLMDADGTTKSEGHSVYLATTSDEIRQDVTDLVQSLGGTTSVRKKTSTYTYDGQKKVGKKCYYIYLTLPSDINPFKLPRKASKVEPKTKYTPSRSIEKIEPVGVKEAKCIKIDSEDELYITDDYIVTHNTTVIGGYALEKVMRSDEYEKMILSKPLEIVTHTRYWGTVPGDEEEKFDPFLKSFKIMFENMTSSNGASYIEQMINKGDIEFMPLELMRGATLQDCICWYDEAQNLNHHEVQTLGSRIDDEGQSKIVLSGDMSQRDRSIDRGQTGIMRLLQAPEFRESPLTAHVHLRQNERGDVSQLFNDIFREDD